MIPRTPPPAPPKSPTFKDLEDLKSTIQEQSDKISELFGAISMLASNIQVLMKATPAERIQEQMKPEDLESEKENDSSSEEEDKHTKTSSGDDQKENPAIPLASSMFKPPTPLTPTQPSHYHALVPPILKDLNVIAYETIKSRNILYIDR
ncbi:hypothetical protein ADUPG1_013168 [Aduncisulcus paluster]|uniref:Phosphoprotein n=1 Tax=Aduncisulcus paluster TaxID=2918883 RepID=A0ABQ5K662_9EUKA|nr:hypothetical protein ADUPG1_013168 [Aduncisulcus paluster]